MKNELMNTEDILVRAEQRRQQTLDVLRILGLMEKWSHFGEPKIVGAVRYGLVVAPDIDLAIYTEFPQIQHGFEVMSVIAKIPGVWKIRYSNELDRPDQGLYWQIRYRVQNGEIWKIDNWLLSRDHLQRNWDERFACALEHRLTQETRRAILQIKEALLGREDVRGIDIYRAVLEGNVLSPNSFLDWLKIHPPDLLEYWLPAC